MFKYVYGFSFDYFLRLSECLDEREKKEFISSVFTAYNTYKTIQTRYNMVLT